MMKKLMAAVLAMIMALAACGIAAAEQEARKMETPADAEEFITAFLGDHPEDMERGPVGKVLEILEHSRESFVAELLPGSFVSPLNNRLPEVVSIHGSRKGAVLLRKMSVHRQRRAERPSRGFPLVQASG